LPAARWLGIASLALAACGDNAPHAPASLTLSPAALALMAGYSAQVSAQLDAPETADAPAFPFTWTSSDTTIATVVLGPSSTATVTGVAMGTATISVDSHGLTATLTATIAPPTLESITVDPATVSLPLGEARELFATGLYSSGATVDLTSYATWSSSAPTIVHVDPSGIITGVAAGTSTVTATFDAVSGTSSITVTP
jgi:uncharacterized protein YjdB